MKQHFVTFYSPGTFVAEHSELPIDAWDVDKAVNMARNIKERYGATPYGFEFTTRERGAKDLDSKISKTSNFYFLGGKIETIEEVAARADPKEAILLSNMRCNGWKRIIENRNSWRWTQPLKDTDIVLDYKVMTTERESGQEKSR